MELDGQKAATQKKSADAATNGHTPLPANAPAPKQSAESLSEQMPAALHTPPASRAKTEKEESKTLKKEADKDNETLKKEAEKESKALKAEADKDSETTPAVLHTPPASRAKREKDASKMKTLKKEADKDNETLMALQSPAAQLHTPPQTLNKAIPKPASLSAHRDSHPSTPPPSFETTGPRGQPLAAAAEAAAAAAAAVASADVPAARKTRSASGTSTADVLAQPKHTAARSSSAFKAVLSSSSSSSSPSSPPPSTPSNAAGSPLASVNAEFVRSRFEHYATKGQGILEPAQIRALAKVCVCTLKSKPLTQTSNPKPKP